MNRHATCATPFGLPPLRAELQAAHDAMGASDDYHAFAVCRTYDGLLWEVNIRQGNIFSALDACYPDRDTAVLAGANWLRECRERTPCNDEQAHRTLWREWVAQSRPEV